MLKKYIIVLCFALFSCQNISNKNDTLVQYSTLEGLIKSDYEGDQTVADAASYGDTGLGTFNGLDGEMVAANGNFYQIDEYCLASKVPPDKKTPFFAVTYFEPEKTITLPAQSTYNDVKKIFKKELLSSKNLFYGLKIEGELQFIKLRSVPKQTPPYKKGLLEVVNEQSIFYLQNIRGTLVGFWTPEVMEGVNVPGFHLHFISEDERFGGHVIDFRTNKAKLFADETEYFLLKVNK